MQLKIVSNPTRRMAPIWSWSQEAQKEHLEVRPALKPGEGARVVKIDGGFAMAARDWVYWRLPTVTTCETFGDDVQTTGQKPACAWTAGKCGSVSSWAM